MAGERKPDMRGAIIIRAAESPSCLPPAKPRPPGYQSPAPGRRWARAVLAAKNGERDDA